MFRSITLSLIILFSTLIADNIVFEENSSRSIFNYEATDLEQTTIEFSLDKINMEIINSNGDPFARISHAKQGYFQEPGVPDLPRFSRFIAIPNEGEVSFLISGFETEVISGFQPYPVQPDRSESTPAPYLFTMNEDIYGGEELFPAQLAEISQPMILRDHRIIQLTIDPIQFDPVEKTYTVYKNISLKIITNGRGGHNPKVNNNKRSFFFKGLYQDLILNYELLQNRDTSIKLPVI